MTHETIRTGSPHKLELVKTIALFEEERVRRVAYREALASLEGQSQRWAAR